MESRTMIILAVGLIIGVVAFVGWFITGGNFQYKPDGSQFIPGFEMKTPTEPVPAPNVEGKIKGYWSSQSSMVISELDDAEHMKEIGINTVTFSPQLSHTQEGQVTESPGAESYVKNAINKAHEAGLRVMLETTPMNAGEVDPKVTNVPLFQQGMTEVALKYARIAEEYNVEYFSPIVEPAHHMSVEEADEWLQEILPKIKEVYSGSVMWKKQSMHLENAKEFDQDHTLNIGFKLGEKNFDINMKSDSEGKLYLSIGKDKIYLEEFPDTGEVGEKELNLDTGQWHNLRIVHTGSQISIYLDDELMIEYEDDRGPHGGYSITSNDLRINEFEITDSSGNKIVTEDFTTLNNWNARSGWSLENSEIVITSNVESSLIHDIDFSGYDYIAIDTFKRGQVQTNEDYIDNLEFVIDKTNQQAESDGVPYVIIAEFGGSVLEEIGWIDVDERAKIPMTEEELAQVTLMVLEIAEDTVDGYMYNGWDIEGQGINVVPEVEAVIREWYTTH